MSDAKLHKLTKASSPCWDKFFATEEAARLELLSHICGSCLTGNLEYVGEGGKTEVEQRKAPNRESMEDLLGTACGCEYWYEPPTE